MEKSLKKMHLLLVDDNPHTLSADKEVLERAGYTVTDKQNAEAALTAFRENPDRYDVIITDMKLGNAVKNGLWLTKEAKKISSKIRIIAYTVFGNKKESHALLEAGASRYVYRQSDPTDLLKVIQTLADDEALQKVVHFLKTDHWASQIIHGSGGGIAVVDRAYRLVYANKEMEHISATGIKPGGVCWHEYNGDTQQKEACVWCPVKKLFDNQSLQARPGSMETAPTRSDGITISDKDGKAHFYIVTATPLFSEDGRLIGAIEAVRDFTQAEELLSESLDKRLDLLLGHLQQGTGCTRLRLFLLSPDKNYLLGLKTLGPHPNCPDFRKVRLSITKDICSKLTLESRAIQLFPPSFSGRDHSHDSELQIGDLTRMEIPLFPKGSDKAVGKVVLDHFGTPRTFAEADKENKMVRLFAEELADIVQEKWESEAHDARIKHLENLREFEKKLAAYPDRQTLTKTILDLSKQYIGADWGHMRIWEEGALRLFSGSDDHYVRHLDFHIDPSVPSASAQILSDPEHKPVIVNFAPDDRYHKHIKAAIQSRTDLSDSEKKERITAWDKVFSCATFALLDGDKVLATLSLQSLQSDFFTDEQVSSAKDFVDRAAQWIRLAMFVEGKQRRIRQLEILARLDAELQHEDLNRICRKTVATLCSQEGPHCSRAAMFLRTFNSSIGLCS